MHCQHCHTDCPENHRFCANCGQPLHKPVLGTLWIPSLVLAGMFAVGLLAWLFV